MNDKFYLYLIIFILINNGICGIVGGFILYANKDAQCEESDIWNQTLINSIFMLLLSCGMGGETHYVIKDGEKYSISSITTFIISIFIPLWGVIIYNEMDTDTRNMYKSEYHQLYNYFEFITIYYLVIYSIYGLIFFVEFVNEVYNL